MLADGPLEHGTRPRRVLDDDYINERPPTQNPVTTFAILIWGWSTQAGSCSNLTTDLKPHGQGNTASQQEQRKHYACRKSLRAGRREHRHKHFQFMQQSVDNEMTRAGSTWTSRIVLNSHKIAIIDQFAPQVARKTHDATSPVKQKLFSSAWSS